MIKLEEQYRPLFVAPYKRAGRKLWLNFSPHVGPKLAERTMLPLRSQLYLQLKLDSQLWKGLKDD
jgi:hypothetical protein